MLKTIKKTDLIPGVFRFGDCKQMSEKEPNLVPICMTNLMSCRLLKEVLDDRGFPRLMTHSRSNRALVGLSLTVLAWHTNNPSICVEVFWCRGQSLYMTQTDMIEGSRGTIRAQTSNLGEA
jgi:hypothetical protein